jgi:dTDP-4-amino-4,6-dideoxygalactose transaminase
MTKTSVESLAILGVSPAFDEKLHVGRPNIGDRQRLLSRFNDMLDRRWLTNSGPFEQEFERRIEALLGVRHCIAMCNATIALEITIRALGLAGEVIIPSFTFIATAHALQWQQITPVFADIDPLTHNLDPQCVEQMITPRTSGILGVHVWGRPCPVRELTEIAQRHNLKLMFDAAHAFAHSLDGRMVGNFGQAEVFSFHATKFLNTFEGGAVVTNDDELAEKIRLMKNFGFAGYDNVIYIGTNGKMNEISAAMGLTNLESLDELIETNRCNYRQYQQGLMRPAGCAADRIR